MEATFTPPVPTEGTVTVTITSAEAKALHAYLGNLNSNDDKIQCAADELDIRTHELVAITDALYFAIGEVVR